MKNTTARALTEKRMENEHEEKASERERGIEEFMHRILKTRQSPTNGTTQIKHMHGMMKNERFVRVHIHRGYGENDFAIANRAIEHQICCTRKQTEPATSTKCLL